MTPLEKIDKILYFLKERSDIGAGFSREYIWNLYIEKTPELKINRHLYDEILKKLVEDGYIRETKNSMDQPVYYTTLKGLSFDGYQNIELEVLKLKKKSDLLADRSIVLTALVALGTLVSAVYYLLEILNHFYQIYPLPKK